MNTQTPEQLAATRAALEAQRALLGDVVVDSALGPLRAPEIAASAQQLKQVSALFVDVVGSTAVGQQHCSTAYDVTQMRFNASTGQVVIAAAAIREPARIALVLLALFTMVALSRRHVSRFV